MKDEIKEILDNTLEYLEGIDETRNTKILTTNETYILLDYITNSQEEKDKYKNVIDKIKEIIEADLSNMQKLIEINIILKKDELLEEVE